MAGKDFKLENGLYVADSATIVGGLRVEGNAIFAGNLDVSGSFGGSTTTDDLSEGSSNLYYTTARHDSDTLNQVDSAYVSLRAKTLSDVTMTTSNIVDPLIDSTAVYGQLYGGLSVNVDEQLGGTQSVFNFRSDSDGRGAVVAVGVNEQVTSGIGVTGTSASNDFTIGFEGTTTSFSIKSNVGTTFDFANGTDLLTLTPSGVLNITNSTQATSKTSASITTAGGIGADKDIRAENFIAVNNVQVGTNGTGKLIGNVQGQVSDISNHTTTDLAEGNNLYYTTARFDSDFGDNTTSDLTEGSNLYYTTARADSDARHAISVNDGGGDGSLSYNPSTGVIVYQGPSAAEVRAHFSAGTGVTITNGQVAIGQSVGTGDSVEFGGMTITGDLTVGGNYILNEVTDLRVTNAMIKLADSNAGDAVDIGVVGRYSDDGGVTIRRAGFVRDATNGEWYTFTNLVQNGLDDSPSDQTINFNDSTFELGTWNFGALRGRYLGFDSDFRVFSTNYVDYDSDFTAVSAGRYAVDTSNGPITVTLPASPTTGDYIKLIDTSNWTTNTVTVARNGSTIEGYTDNFELDIGQSIIEFIYINNTWQVYSSIGQRGVQGEKGDSADVTNFASPSQAIAYSIALG